jgi:small subunit ribosomal protein S16
MAVKIRLSRAGKKKVPFHRIVVVDGRDKRDGASLETLGTYDGLNTSVINFDVEGYLAWVKKGAQPTDSAKKVYKLYKKSTGEGEQPAVQEKKATKKTVSKKSKAKTEASV